MSKKQSSLTEQALSTLILMGKQIKTARLRRNLTIEHVAGRAGISLGTVTRLEKGDPGVSLGALTSVLTALNLETSLETVAQPAADLVGINLDSLKKRKRARTIKEDDRDLDANF